MRVSWIAAIGPTLPSTWKAVLGHATQRMADLAGSAGDATLFAVSNMALALGLASSKCSYKDLNGQRVIDHIAAEIWIVIIRLGTLVCSPRTRQQRMAARLCRRNPIVFPASPCVPVYRVEEFALNPRRASIKANPDFGDIGVARPKRRGKWCRDDRVRVSHTRGGARSAISVSSPRAAGGQVFPRNHPNSRSRKSASSPETAAWPQ